MKRKGLVFVLSIATTISIMAQKTTNVFTYRTGACEVSLLSEGQQNGNPAILIGATPQMLEKHIPNGTFANATNAFVIKGNGKVILIDTGHGQKLFDNLQTLGITAEQVNAVLLTHMHGDHIGGLLRNGKAAFANAELFIAQAEYDYWLNSSSQNIQNILLAYKNKLRLFTPASISQNATALLPGIYGIAAYGHTPGHTAFLLESDNRKMLIWGDVTHAMAIQMPCPEIAVTYDTNPKTAIESRKTILKHVSENKIPVAGMHIAYPAMGNITNENSNNGFKFVPFGEQ